MKKMLTAILLFSILLTGCGPDIKDVHAEETRTGKDIELGTPVPVIGHMALVDCIEGVCVYAVKRGAFTDCYLAIQERLGDNPVFDLECKAKY